MISDWVSLPKVGLSRYRNRGSKCDALWLRIPGSLRHIIKRSLRTTVFRRAWSKKTVFLSGCQRSGSAMMLWTLDLSMLTKVYDEGEHNRAFRHHRVREPQQLLAIRRQLNAPILVLRTMCDAHKVDRFLDDDPYSRVLWIYRNYRDVARSAVNRWGEYQLATVRAIANSKEPKAEWHDERIGKDTLSVLEYLYERDTTELEGAALFWYMRNRLFFKLGLNEHRRVRLVRYEDLVRWPISEFRAVFEWLNLPFSVGYTDWIHGEALDRGKSVELNSRVDHVCSKLLCQLDESKSDSHRKRG